MDDVRFPHNGTKGPESKTTRTNASSSSPADGTGGEVCHLRLDLVVVCGGRADGRAGVFTLSRRVNLVLHDRQSYRIQIGVDAARAFVIVISIWPARGPTRSILRRRRRRRKPKINLSTVVGNLVWSRLTAAGLLVPGGRTHHCPARSSLLQPVGIFPSPGYRGVSLLHRESDDLVINENSSRFDGFYAFVVQQCRRGHCVFGCPSVRSFVLSSRQIFLP